MTAEEKRAQKREYNRRYRETHAEQRKEYMRKYHETRREQMLEMYRKYREANKEKLRADYRKYYSENRERLRERYRAWHASKNGHAPSTCGPTESELRQSHGGGCWVCGSTHRLAVDHCHKTGYRRGILCHNCNVSLGLLKDAPIRVLKMLSYLYEAERKLRDLSAGPHKPVEVTSLAI